MLALVYPKGQLQFSKIQYSVGKNIYTVRQKQGKTSLFKFNFVSFLLFFKKQGLELLEFSILPRSGKRALLLSGML